MSDKVRYVENLEYFRELMGEARDIELDIHCRESTPMKIKLSYGKANVYLFMVNILLKNVLAVIKKDRPK